MSMLKKVFYKLRGWWQKDELYDSFRKIRGGKWVIGYDDWKRLERIVTQYRPKHILDLGTGIGGSVTCITKVARGGAIIHTVEQSEKCIRIAKELIPKEFQNQITFHHSDIEIIEFSKIPFRHFIQYKNLPRGDWDLIVIDGPWLKFENEKLIDLPASDILSLFSELKTGCLIYLDNRRELRVLMERHFYSYLDMLEKDDRFIFWKRNSKPFSDLDDALFEKIKAYGYFDR